MGWKGSSEPRPHGLQFAVVLALAGCVVWACEAREAESEGPDPRLPPRSASPAPDAAATAPPIVADASGPPSPYVDFDINHVLVTGQANAVSNNGTPVLTTTQPFTNLMFDTGVMPMKGGFTNPDNHTTPPTPDCDDEGCTGYDPPTKLVPLVEGDRFYDYGVETCASGLANEISHLATTRHAMKKHDVLVSIHGRSGTTYQCLRKGSCDYKPNYLPSFDQGMKEVASAKDLAAALGKSYVVRAVATIHGEADHATYTSGAPEFPLNGTDGKAGAIAGYADGLLEWQRDYEAGIKAITKQTVTVPLFVSQLSGWADTPGSKVAQAQLDAHIKSAGKVILIGPSYPLPLSQVDCFHFTNEGERRLGEYFAKVYEKVIFEGKTWEPLRPKTVTRAGTAITVVFHVPKPPLVIDTTAVAAVASQGFTYADASGAAAPAIATVELVGEDTVRVTLATEPTGTDKRLKYAMNQTAGACIGTPAGARGNLRDSDDTPSKYGYDLHNWAVNFDISVP